MPCCNKCIIVVFFFPSPLSNPLESLVLQLNCGFVERNYLIFCTTTFVVDVYFTCFFAQIWHVIDYLRFSCMFFKYIKFWPQNNILTFHKWTYNAFHFMYLSIFTFQHLNPWKLCSPNLLTFLGKIIVLFWLI